MVVAVNHQDLPGGSDYFVLLFVLLLLLLQPSFGLRTSLCLRPRVCGKAYTRHARSTRRINPLSKLFCCCRCCCVICWCFINCRVVVRFLDLGPARFCSRMIRKINRRIWPGKKQKTSGTTVSSHTVPSRYTAQRYSQGFGRIRNRRAAVRDSEPVWGCCCALAGHAYQVYPQPAIMARSSSLSSESGAHNACMDVSRCRTCLWACVAGEGGGVSSLVKG